MKPTNSYNVKIRITINGFSYLQYIYIYIIKDGKSRYNKFKYFTGCLAQILLVPFLNTLSQIMLQIKQTKKDKKQKHKTNCFLKWLVKI